MPSRSGQGKTLPLLWYFSNRPVRPLSETTYKPLIYAVSFVPSVSFAAIYLYLRYINIKANDVRKVVRNMFRKHVPYLRILLLFWGTLGQSTEYYVAGSL
jgi:hypothetical protein